MNKQLTKRFEYQATIRYAAFGATFGATFPLIGTIIRMLLERTPITMQRMWQTQVNDPLLWVVDTAPIVIGLFSAYSGYKQDLLTRANAELNLREVELKQQHATLEKRVEERTAELEIANEYNEKRAKQFEAITQVSRVINRTQNLQDILPQITQVISQQFNYYHVGIFLLDALRENAMLSAANSEGGQKMLERHHKLRVEQVGIVGYVAETAKPRIALDTGADAIYFNNPDLPETRSEMALPLLQSDRQIIGVLDIQSTEPNAFNLENIEILSMLAEQVAVAISNARLYEKTQRNLLESEMLYRRDLQSGWRKFTRAQKITGVRRAGIQAHVYTQAMEIPGEDEVRKTGRAYINMGKGRQLTIPVKLRGEMVGMLNIKSDEEHKWTQDEMDIVTAIVERAALSIENARLLTESRKTAEKEHIVGEIAAKISAYTNRDNILKAAVTELGRNLPGAEVILQLQNSSKNDMDLR
jgi:GAF domain-containing protein